MRGGSAAEKPKIIDLKTNLMNGFGWWCVMNASREFKFGSLTLYQIANSIMDG